ncbi:efflux RND transporter periplasmic adaptor subunit [Rubinisphaera margarita]|uniref:efflux RND transporter periplasmic adaptor subunit n=1 Tax=Rubinisphaera margarita TaxID=2909586 RepID=UPI001EE92695|nr:efflux RND transporter periplasmic adaptor subunit [Rubinisphaera margarita]MCG6156263.1 efflux RND transporter periplasmic adaptor subunit [Rubinisphaera margarita]
MKFSYVDSHFRLCTLFIVAGATLFLAVGCGGTQGAPPQQPPPEVTVAAPIRKQIVEWDEYTGRLEAIDYVEIRSRVSGYLQSIHFDEGQMVEKNDLLFVIDPRPFQAELNGARSDVTQAESQLAQARATLEDAKARLKQSEAQRQLVETQVQRVRKLRDQNAATQDELDQFEAEYLTAEADVSASNAGISSAEATIETAKAGIESAKARVETAELNLEYTRIYAPVAGRISRQMVTEGNLVSGGSASSTLLTTITSVAPIYCYFDATEQEVLKYTRLAQSGARESSRVAKNPVFLALVDEKGFPHLGHMDFVDNRFDANTASMRARCVFPNDDQVLIPGMFARIRIPGSAPYQAILIPDSAIGTDQSTQFVYLVNDGIVEQRTIEVGPLVDGLRVVRNGLAGSEKIITQGLLQARPEMQVVTRDGTIESLEDGLPDNYEPLPPEQWISPKPDPLPEFTRTGRNLTADKEGDK